MDEFLFRRRFWAIAALFTAGFSAAFLDPVNVVVGAVLGFGVDPESPGFMLWVKAGFGFGAVLVILAAAIRTWAAAYLGSAVIHDAELHAERLVADGPYRHVRNPLYLGLLLLVFGFALAASRLGFAILAAGSWVLVRRIIAHEESRLLASQGAAFEAYRRAVPRLLFSPRPRVPASGRRPLIAQAFLGEAFFWVFAAGAIAFAASPGQAALLSGMGVGLGVYGISLLILRRRAV
jgi:protein-S-isoprenylcysteine O-methyltransferase Ste14